MEILEHFNPLSFFVGVHLLFVGGIITMTESGYGIVDIPRSSTVLIALLFMTGLLCLVSSFVL